MQVVLLKAGLENHYMHFERAGFKFMDPLVYLSDDEIEAMIAQTEQHNNIDFKEERVLLWKALRYQWFRGPGHVHRFIERSEVPGLALPKLDYKMVDSMIKMSEIDPDRQRQMLRKTKPSTTPGFRGPAVITMQFEVFKRQQDIHYEYKDLERCVNEWQNRNPYMMTHEDPREVVLKMRIHNLEEAAKLSLEERLRMEVDKWRISMLLHFMRLVVALLSILMLFTAFYRFRDTPSEILLDFVAGSKQFQSSISFFTAYMFIYGVSMRKHPDVLENKLGRLLVSCQRMKEAISDFRVETGEFRREDEEMDEAFLGYNVKQEEQQVEVQSPKSKKNKSRDLDLGGGARRRGKKKKKDPALAMWCGPDAHKKIQDKIEIGEGMTRSLAAAAQRFPEIQVESAYKFGASVGEAAALGFRVGDEQHDRMGAMRARFRPHEGHEDELCHRPERRPPRTPSRLEALSDSAMGFALPPQPSLPGPPGMRSLPIDNFPSGPSGDGPRAAATAFGGPPVIDPLPPPPAGNRDMKAARNVAASSLPAVPRIGASEFSRSQKSSKELATELATEQTSDLHPWLPGHMPNS